MHSLNETSHFPYCDDFVLQSDWLLMKHAWWCNRVSECACTFYSIHISQATLCRCLFGKFDSTTTFSTKHKHACFVCCSSILLCLVVRQGSCTVLRGLYCRHCLAAVCVSYNTSMVTNSWFTVWAFVLKHCCVCENVDLQLLRWGLNCVMFWRLPGMVTNAWC